MESDSKLFILVTGDGAPLKILDPPNSPGISATTWLEHVLVDRVVTVAPADGTAVIAINTKHLIAAWRA